MYVSTKRLPGPTPSASPDTRHRQRNPVLRSPAYGALSTERQCTPLRRIARRRLIRRHSLCAPNRTAWYRNVKSATPRFLTLSPKHNSHTSVSTDHHNVYLSKVYTHTMQHPTSPTRPTVVEQQLSTIHINLSGETLVVFPPSAVETS